jgi:hypothetical protein
MFTTKAITKSSLGAVALLAAALIAAGSAGGALAAGPAAAAGGAAASPALQVVAPTTQRLSRFGLTATATCFVERCRLFTSVRYFDKAGRLIRVPPLASTPGCPSTNPRMRGRCGVPVGEPFGLRQPTPASVLRAARSIPAKRPAAADITIRAVSPFGLPQTLKETIVISD